jgi:nicotinamide phosphoribosyltransferase
MWKQYPPKTERIYSYIESRGGIYDKTLFFGLQAFIQKNLLTPFTIDNVIKAKIFWENHGEPFNFNGWVKLLEKHKGFLPIEIKSIDEGSITPTGTVLATVENTDEEFPWITTWIETALLRAIWYPTTVATRSWHIKQIIKKYMDLCDDAMILDYMLHDFGSRGVSSQESAMIGGSAHLINFQGTDTFICNNFINEYYSFRDMPNYFGVSIPAAEHSTVTSWGQVNEIESYRNMIKQFGSKICAIVCDSYNVYDAVDMLGSQLKNDILEAGGRIIVRPDSGNPLEILPILLKKLNGYFGFYETSTGHKVLKNVGLIWGDGINEAMIESILKTVTDLGYSASNVAFGMGGQLLQAVDRDTLSFAMKCSAIQKDGEWHDVFKNPITDFGKRSKKGRFLNDNLVTRYKDGVLHKKISFDQIRKNANQGEYKCQR